MVSRQELVKEIKKKLGLRSIHMKTNLLEYTDWLQLLGYATDIPEEKKEILVDRFIQDKMKHIQKVLQEGGPS